MLAGYLASTGSESLIDAACLISVCWDFNVGTSNLENGPLNRQLNRYLTQSLIDVVLKHQQFFETNQPELLDLEALSQCQSLRQFDNTFTKRMFNFANAEEYYTKSTHKDKIGQIKVPTFCISAADDMIMPKKGNIDYMLQSTSHNSEKSRSTL